VARESIASLIFAILLSACAFAQPDVPAIIDKPTAESRAELARAVRSELNDVPVMLADDALTKDSLLVIDKAHLLGRDFDRPEEFRLVKAGKDCALVHERTGKRTTLASTTCLAQSH